MHRKEISISNEAPACVIANQSDIFPPTSCSSAFLKFHQAIMQVSDDCRHVHLSRLFQRSGQAKVHAAGQSGGVVNHGHTASTTKHTPAKHTRRGNPLQRLVGGTTKEGATCTERRKEGSTVLKLVKNSLELVGPAADIVRLQQQNWFQLSGHPGTLSLAGPGTLWKKVQGANSAETAAYTALMNEPQSRHLVPEFHGQVQHNGEHFIEIDDLLFGFKEACVMDIKIGTRTFLETEVNNNTPRKDLYKKMVSVSADEPTAEERLAGAVTKLRYMTFRERASSTSSLGFRIEGLKMSSSEPVGGLKHIVDEADVLYTMCVFVRSSVVAASLLRRLRHLRDAVENSHFFARHQVIGSSILLVYDRLDSGAWIIDLAKTVPVPESLHLDHRGPWRLGNMEDGYLTGIDNLIRVLEKVVVRLGGSRKS